MCEPLNSAQKAQRAKEKVKKSFFNSLRVLSRVDFAIAIVVIIVIVVIIAIVIVIVIVIALVAVLSDVKCPES